MVESYGCVIFYTVGVFLSLCMICYGLLGSVAREEAKVDRIGKLEKKSFVVVCNCHFPEHSVSLCVCVCLPWCIS